MNVQLLNVTKRFLSLRGEVAALQDISLEISDKEFFVILGPSGCGKTTLLNVIAGLEGLTGGDIYFDDTTVASRTKKVFLTPRERNIAFVFQSYALYPHLTVFANIAFPLRVVKTAEQEVRNAVEGAASLLEISSLLSAKPAELSGGQRQRVAIARAIVRQPNLFLLDEPLSNLDARLRATMRAELKKLQRQLGVTTIYVTHDQTEALSMGDRIAVLRHGAVEQVGTPQELYDSPSNPFVAGFIGSPSMNLLPSSFVKEGEACFITVGNNRVPVPTEAVPRLAHLRTTAFILGIRPEHVTVQPASSTHSPPATIVSLESLERETLMHLAVETQKLSVLTTKANFKEGNTVTIALNLQRAHFFESGHE